MDNSKKKYISPFSTRYASDEMQHVFSEEFKFKTWRRLWIALAKAEKQLGLDITDEQIAEMEKFKDDINFEVAQEREKLVRHDVMSHVYAYGQQCPKAEPIIHLGATSCYVGDNTDVIIMKEASGIILANIEELEHRITNLKLLGSKGTTGTQASFMELFSGNEEKVKKLEALIAEDMGFESCVAVSGQTYSRKTDAYFLSVLSGFAQSAYKFSNDLRILQSFEEMEEPFEKNQIGSSAMPYKRNPMRSERISSLARYVICDSLNPAFTAGTQWFERTLDDSANKRISVAEAFLAVDAILNIYINVTGGLVVYDKVIHRRIMEKLPFMATENIMMQAVKKGGNRQKLHEKLRVHSHAAAAKVKLEGGKNDLIERIAADDAFPVTLEEIKSELDPKLYVGRSVSQVEEFLADIAKPVIDKYCKEEIKAVLNV